MGMKKQGSHCDEDGKEMKETIGNHGKKEDNCDFVFDIGSTHFWMGVPVSHINALQSL